MRVAEIAYSSSSRSIIRLTSGSVRKFVREWAAKTEQAKDAGRPRTRRYGADRGHRHATVCSRPGTQRNLRTGPLAQLSTQDGGGALLLRVLGSAQTTRKETDSGHSHGFAQALSLACGGGGLCGRHRDRIWLYSGRGRRNSRLLQGQRRP